MKKISIVNHTHWDREWYFSAEDSIFLSDKLFTDAIVELEKHPSASFTLDGQISILNDYVEIRPEMMDRVKRLVANNQLIIGPWFTQPDALHIKGESLLRNGMLGILDSQKYGKYLTVGYLPDTFGFNSQMPVILNQLGLSSFVFWRGLNVKKTGGYYFNWQSLGRENHVAAINMPQGYSTGMLLNDNHDYVDKRLDNAVEFISEIEHGNNILIPSGNDQLDIIKDYQKKVKRINDIGKYQYETSDYQTFAEKISKYNDLPNYVGEFIDPVLARVHRTSSSSRMNIKLAARKLESELIEKVEPMLVIARSMGLDISQNLLIRSWKKLLESQAHDSMAGSVTDSVEQDIMHRLKEGMQISDDIINTVENLIAKKIDLNKNEILVFNPSAHVFKGYKKIELLTKLNDPKLEGYPSEVISQKFVKPRENVLMQDETGDHYIKERGYYISDVLVKIELPALGFKVFKLIEHNDENSIQISNVNNIRNEQISIKYKDDQIEISNKKHSWKDTILVEDVANDGDTYDFSPLRNGQKFILKFDQCTSRTHHNFSEMILSGSRKLPKSQVQEQYQNQFETVRYKLHIILLSNDDRIRFKFTFDNKVLDHRVRIGIRTGVISQTNIASVPFGFIERSATEQKNNDWAEVPINIYPFDSNVTLKDGDRSVSVISKDISEYQQDKDIIWLTIMATTNELGKPNLVYRPGRASGDTTKQGHIMIQTPDAELLGLITESFSLVLDQSDEIKIQQMTNNDDLSTPNYQEQELNLFHNRLDNKIQFPIVEKRNLKNLELLNLPNDYLVSSIYPSYFTQGEVILRLENVSHDFQKLDPKYFGENYKIVNAIEHKIDGDVVIAPMSVISIKMKF